MDDAATLEEVRTIELASALAPVRAAEYEHDGLRTLEAVSTYPPVDSEEIAVLYADELTETKTILRNIHAEQTRITAPLSQALNAALDFFRKARIPFEQTELILKGHLGQWKMAQTRAQEIAQREAEERARVARASMREEAQALEDAGDTQQALELNEAAAMMPTPIVASPPKLPGVSIGGTWYAVVTDKRALIQFIAQRAEYENLLEVKQSAVDGLARSLKDKLSIPGVEARMRARVAARAKT